MNYDIIKLLNLEQFNVKFQSIETTKINNILNCYITLEKIDLANHGVLKRWVKQYKERGTIVETRGIETKITSPNKGRPRKYLDRPLEEYTKEELIERLKMAEDIKKSLVYLMNQKPKKNTK